MAGRLDGKACIITGIGSGMGEKAVALFCREGACVVGCDVDVAAAEATVARARADGGEAYLAPVGDLGDPANCRDLVALAETTLGGVDVLYNNAARAHFAFMDEIDVTVWDRCIRDELDLAFYMCLAACRASRAVGNVAHMAAKAGVVAMTRQMALEGGAHGIRVNSVSPGPVATAQTAWVLDSDEYRQATADFLVLGRVGRPHDVAHYAVFLASDESAWITGTDLLIDGGHAVL